MRFYSIIIALLLVPMISNAQSDKGNGMQSVAKLEQNKAITEKYLDEVNADETYTASSLVFTTDKRINSVKVVDEAGEVVMATTSNGEGAKFNLNKLRKGLYYVKIYCDGENIVRKFFKK
jgi:phosphoribosyl-ATP pyrophosphohydrolase